MIGLKICQTTVSVSKLVEVSNIELIDQFAVKLDIDVQMIARQSLKVDNKFIQTWNRVELCTMVEKVKNTSWKKYEGKVALFCWKDLSNSQ